MATATHAGAGGMTQAKMDGLIQALQNLNYSVTGIDGFAVAAQTAIHVAYEGGAAVADDSSDAFGQAGVAWAGVCDF